MQDPVSADACSLCSGLQPAVQYLAGELAVEAGMVLPLRAAHNTVAMRFDIEVCGTPRDRAYNALPVSARMSSAGRGRPSATGLESQMHTQQWLVLPRRMVQEAEYLNLAKPDASFPPRQFAMLADTARNEVDSCTSFL
jgi:hypothetical protein